MKDNWPQNLLLVALFGIVTLFTAYQERFLPMIGAFFWLVLIAGFAALRLDGAEYHYRTLARPDAGNLYHRVHQGRHWHQFRDVVLSRPGQFVQFRSVGLGDGRHDGLLAGRQVGHPGDAEADRRVHPGAGT